MTDRNADRFDPVPFDVDATHARWMRDPAFRAAYDSLADEYAALSELLRARQAAGLTQAQVARRMGISQAAVGRLESSAGSRKHAPSLPTLRRYADALNCNLLIALRPKAAASAKKAAASRNPIAAAKKKAKAAKTAKSLAIKRKRA